MTTLNSLENKVVQKTVNSKSIKFGQNTVTIDGKEHVMGNGLKPRLFKNFKLHEKTINNITNNTSALPAVMKSAVQNSTNRVLVSFNKKGQIVDIDDITKNRIVSSDAFRTLVSNIGNVDSSLGLDEVIETGTGYYASLISDKQKDFGGDEVFKFGMIVLNDLDDGIKIQSKNIRLVCANGMVLTKTNDLEFGRDMSEEQWNIFFNQLENLKRNGWVSPNFTKRMEEARNTKLSVQEFLDLNSYIKFNDPNKGTAANEYFDSCRIKSAFSRNGVDIEKVSNKTKRGLRTDMTAWEGINNVTHFASHYNGLSQMTRDAMKVKAGYMLETKTFDLKGVQEVMQAF